MESLLQDLRYAVRILRKKPGLTLVLLLTLTLGIGATTAIFSVANAVLFRPLLFKEGDRLLRLYDVRHRDDGQTSQVSFSPRNFYQVREQAQAFESVAAQVLLNLNFVLGETPERVVGIGVSDQWLSTLGVQPFLGRGFSAEEEKAASNSRVVLVSYGFWERRFGSDSDALGMSITLDNQPYTIIGVLPRGFDYPYRTELWLPWSFDRNNGRTHPLNVQARLKPGVSPEQAQLELDTIAGRLAQEFPETNAGYAIRAVPLREVLIEGRDKVIMILLAAVGFLLLIACANIANLLLARSIGRQKEFAIRAALGASRMRQIRQYLTENVLLSVLGGAAGVLLTFWARDFLMALIPHELTYVMKEVPIDIRVLGFTLLLSILIGAIIALVPALRASRFSLETLLKESGRSGGDPRGQRLLSILVVSEIALTLVLLTGTTLMTQNMYLLERADLGFATDNLLTMKVALTEQRYNDPQQRNLLVEQVLEQIRAVPGVENATAANLVPLTSGNVTTSFIHAGRPVDPNEQLVVSQRIISPGYFEALKIPVLRGRTFTSQDQRASQPVVIINQRMAEHYWPGEDPIGRQVRALRGGAQSPWLAIIGIVGDVEETSPSRIETKESWYVPFAQDLSSERSATTSSVQLAVKTDGEPTSMSQSLKEAIWQVNKNLPVFDIATADHLYDEALSQIRLSTILTLCFSSFGLLMAALGTYGVFSYKVSQRTQEIGIRMALGASPIDVLKLVGKQAVAHILSGVALGLMGAIILTRFMSGVLSEVDSSNPAIFAVVALVLSAIALIACYIPVRKATKVNPIVALRYE